MSFLSKSEGFFGLISNIILHKSSDGQEFENSDLLNIKFSESTIILDLGDITSVESISGIGI